MNDIKFKYYYKNTEFGVITRIFTLLKIESCEPLRYENEDWKIISRCQYIGANDMNDVEIYRGDIVEYKPFLENEYPNLLIGNIIQWCNHSSKWRLSKYSAESYSWYRCTISGTSIGKPCPTCKSFEPDFDCVDCRPF